MKTILATAYSLNPYKGSEEAMGWNYVYQAARFQNVIAVTRINNRESIEKFMVDNPDKVYKNIQFLYFDLPYWMRFWKRGGNGVILYYMLWQFAIPGFVKKQKIHFDIVHNMNFHNDWAPSYLWKLNKPFVWGPIGHHPRIEPQYLKPYKKSYRIKDQFTWMVKKFFWNIFPALKNTVQKAGYIWSMHSEVNDVLDLSEKKYHIGASVATQDYGWLPNKNTEKFTLISAGRLVPLKGFDLSIAAFAEFLSGLSDHEKNNCEFLIVGSGPEENFYKKLATDLGISKYVTFISWIDRTKLMDLYKYASAFLFPSHEGAGMVVPEALSFGLPVICLKNCGPGEFIDDNCGFAVPMQDYQSTVNNLSRSISKLYTKPELLKQMSHNARNKFESHFHWDRRGEQLQSIYQNL